MLLSEISDYLDGKIARHYKATSRLGEILDPMCDSMYRFTIYLSFAILGWISFIIPVILIYRDIFVAYVRIQMVQTNLRAGARISGKMKAVVQAGGAFIIIFVEKFLSHYLGNFPLSLIISIIVAGVTIYSAFDYFYFGYYTHPHRT